MLVVGYLPLCMLRAMASSDPHILVLGLGNTLLSDEAVGVRVVEYLTGWPEADRADLRLMDGGTMGLSLTVAIEDAAALIVVDAANLEGPAGQVVVFEGTDMDAFLRNRGRSPHDIGFDDIMDALRLRQAVPERRALIGIQPGHVGVGETLTRSVAEAVPVAAETISHLLTRWRRPGN